MIQPADRIWRAAVHTFRDQRCRDALTALMRCKHTAAKLTPTMINCGPRFS